MSQIGLITTGCKIALFNRESKLFIGLPELTLNWDAGKLDDYPSTHIIMHTTKHTGAISDGDHVRIKAMSPNIESLEYLYTGQSGWTWYDVFSEDPKQIWKIRKISRKGDDTKEIQNGDIITFESTWYQQNYLCDRSGWLCCDTDPQEWEIEYPKYTKENTNPRPKNDFFKGKAFFNNALKRFSGRQSKRSERDVKLAEDLKKKIDEVESLSQKLTEELRTKKGINDKLVQLRESNEEKLEQLIQNQERIKLLEKKLRDADSELEIANDEIDLKEKLVEELKKDKETLLTEYENAKGQQTLGLAEELRLFKEKEHARFEAEKLALQKELDSIKSKLETMTKHEKEAQDKVLTLDTKVGSLDLIAKNSEKEIAVLKRQVAEAEKEKTDAVTEMKKMQVDMKQNKEAMEKLKSTIPPKDIPGLKDILDKAKKNDSGLTEIVLTNCGLADQNVVDICTALDGNTNVSKLDFSDNVILNGDCAKAVCDLVLHTTVLLELSFTGCPIRGDKVHLMKQSLQRNTSLVQCGFGLNETEEDVQEIEAIMERNFQIMSQ